jgi:phage gp36-like protein|nr:MAG TPA: head to tail adaptor [Caudoviricetes sp.]
MFLTENDYIVASADALTIFQQSTPEKREKAEKMAIEEIAGYLRSRYDTGLIFSAVDDNRNDVIVMHACDITLYHLTSWLPGKMGREIRKERYERAIKWLEEVQAGKVTPNLPTCTGEDGEEDINNPVKWGSGKSNTYIW